MSAAGGLDPAGTGITGSLIVGASMAGVGLVAIGVGAVAGQVTSTSRGANALGSAVLGVFYLLRMVGDLGDGRLTWASPIGWGQQMQPWGANRWWPLGADAAAHRGPARARDPAGGPTRPRRRAAARARRPRRRRPPGTPHRSASALRLQRGPIIGWTLTIVLSALMFGSVVEAMTDLMADAGGTVARPSSGAPASTRCCPCSSP